jgi:malate synthase
MTQTSSSLEIKAPSHPLTEAVLTRDALEFLASLHREFETRRQALLARRRERQTEFDAGKLPDFLSETKAVREGGWQVAPPPADLLDRRVEITGPTERKMVINALNSGARVFMADFEDANTPTWSNLIEGQQNLTDAIERTISFDNPDGRVYRLNDETATLLVRPRGWHLNEKHVRIDGVPMSGSLFDFGLYFFRNAERLRSRGTGPYFYLAKMESHLEARLWNDVFSFSEDRLGEARGTIRATVLIETVLAAFEMEEVLYELRGHSSGLNAGRWDYIFSLIKKFRARADLMTSDRALVTMTVPFMRAYTELLVRTCHRHGAHAIGGMAAFIPNRRDPAVTEAALARVREDKEREANDGFDGTWVAHPDLIPVAKAEFDRVLGDRPNQVERQREDVRTEAGDLLGVGKVLPTITEAGLRNNVSVGIQYINSWLQGVGAAAINNLMEDAATAEISRSQVWQWVRHGARLDDGTTVTAAGVRHIEDEEMTRLRATLGESAGSTLDTARSLFDQVALSDEFIEFLTFPAYELID